MSENKNIEKNGCRPTDPENIGRNETAKPQKEGEKGENAVNSPNEFWRNRTNPIAHVPPSKFVFLRSRAIQTRSAEFFVEWVAVERVENLL